MSTISGTPLDVRPVIAAALSLVEGAEQLRRQTAQEYRDAGRVLVGVDLDPDATVQVVAETGEILWRGQPPVPWDDTWVDGSAVEDVVDQRYGSGPLPATFESDLDDGLVLAVCEWVENDPDGARAALGDR